MSFTLTTKALLLSQKTNIRQQIVLEIDGIETVYGAVHVIKKLEYGDNVKYGDQGLFYGGTVQNPNSKDYISLKGTTRDITQQLLQDKGGTGSVSSVNIELIDKGDFVSRQVSEVEILSRKANVYLMFQGSVFPEDAIKIFRGNISSRSFGSGFVRLKIDHPEQLKRQELLAKVDTELLTAIDNVQTTIPLKETKDLILPSDGFRTFVQVENEIIEYTGISKPNLTGCIRGSHLTPAVAHDSESSTESFYQWNGQATEMALRLMLSGRGMKGDLAISSINVISPTETIQNAINFNLHDIKEELGLQVGDTVNIYDSLLNNVTGRKILYFSTSYFVVDGANLINESATDINKPKLEYKSQWDVLTFGCGLEPSEVDSTRHLEIENLLGSSYPEYQFYFRSEINAKEFLEQQIYFPVGLYQVPRQGKASVGATLPPIASSESKVIGSDSVTNAAAIKIQRSTTSNFYNSVVYKYEESRLDEGKFLKGVITQSEDSINQIKYGAKPLNIVAKGFRNTQDTTNFIESQSRRFIDRYALAAESITVDVNYKTGFNIDVSDTVIFGDEQLKIVDSTNGTRNFTQRVMEVTNKSLGMMSGKVKLQLTDTAFSIGSRFGSFSPSSNVNGGTTVEINIDNEEKFKWYQYIKSNLLIHSEDYSFQEVVELKDITANGLSIEALSIAPIAGMVVDIAPYDGAGEFLKRIHCFACPSDVVISGISTTQFTVADSSLYFIGSDIEINSPDYSIVTDRVKVTNIVGNTITVEDIGVTPASGYEISLIGFSDDGGLPYVYL